MDNSFKLKKDLSLTTISISGIDLDKGGCYSGAGSRGSRRSCSEEANNSQFPTRHFLRVEGDGLFEGLKRSKDIFLLDSDG